MSKYAIYDCHGDKFLTEFYGNIEEDIWTGIELLETNDEQTVLIHGAKIFYSLEEAREVLSVIRQEYKKSRWTEREVNDVKIVPVYLKSCYSVKSGFRRDFMKDDSCDHEWKELRSSDSGELKLCEFCNKCGERR